MKLETRLSLYVTTKRDRSCGDRFRLTATIVTIGTNAYERRSIDSGQTPTGINHDRIRNANDDEPIGGLYLGHLQANNSGNSEYEPRTLNGFDLDFREMFSVDRRQAERMAKTLGTIEKRLEALDAQFGRPSTAGQYLARLAHAIKADSIVMPAENARGWSYDDDHHHIRTVKDAIYYVDAAVDAWVREDEIAKAKREREARDEEYAAKCAEATTDAPIEP